MERERSMARKRVGKSKRAKNTRISEKNELLRREGKTGEQAAGEAYGMERSHRLGRHGFYKHVGRKSKRRAGKRI
jgi:hypothetical protein